MAPGRASRPTWPAMVRSCAEGWRSSLIPSPVGATRLRTEATPSVAAIASVAFAMAARPPGDVRSPPGASR